MSYIPLSELPRFLKLRVSVPAAARDKSALDAALVSLLEDFFAVPRLELDDAIVKEALAGTHDWKAELVLAKLRSLLEKQARRDIQQYCGSLNRADRGAITKKLHAAGLHHFRENLETDLYVGIHTAISANFKMFGVIDDAESRVPPAQSTEALDQLLRALRCIATQPLGVLMAFDGVFWDSKLYSVPRCFRWNDDGFFEIDSVLLEKLLEAAVIDEAPRGCPAMRARTSLGGRALDFVQMRCVDIRARYFSTASSV